MVEALLQWVRGLLTESTTQGDLSAGDKPATSLGRNNRN
jgi:hypothetical protein